MSTELVKVVVMIWPEDGCEPLETDPEAPGDDGAGLADD